MAQVSFREVWEGLLKREEEEDKEAMERRWMEREEARSRRREEKEQEQAKRKEFHKCHEAWLQAEERAQKERERRRRLHNQHMRDIELSNTETLARIKKLEEKRSQWTRQ